MKPCIKPGVVRRITACLRLWRVPQVEAPAWNDLSIPGFAYGNSLIQKSTLDFYNLSPMAADQSQMSIFKAPIPSLRQSANFKRFYLHNSRVYWSCGILRSGLHSSAWIRLIFGVRNQLVPVFSARKRSR